MTPSSREPAPPADEQPWTVARVLRWASEDLARRGLEDSPRLDAELLLSRVLGLDRVKLIVESRRPLTQTELDAFRELLLRRRRAEPIAYILGYREFFGHRFCVSRDTLIPRPDTETLVKVSLDRTRARSLFGRALDLCTGSGCVALSFAKERPTWRVTGSDISPEALEVARANAVRLNSVWNVDFVESDLFERLPSDARYDLVMANAPYISDPDMGELPADIREHEPELALRGGADGLEVLRRLVVAAVPRLEPGGVLALEVGAEQAPKVARGLAGYGLEEVDVERDYGGIERVVSAVRPQSAQAAERPNPK